MRLVLVSGSARTVQNLCLWLQTYAWLLQYIDQFNMYTVQCSTAQHHEASTSPSFKSVGCLSTSSGTQTGHQVVLWTSSLRSVRIKNASAPNTSPCTHVCTDGGGLGG